MSQARPIEIHEVPDTSAEWELTQRVAASPQFSRSHKLKRFLLYVCERSITGRCDEITEQQIGVYVFGRPSDYNPGESSIVRSQARLLRSKLEAYFTNDGSHEEIEIVIPKGTYVPLFRLRKSEPDDKDVPEFQIPPAMPNQPRGMADSPVSSQSISSHGWQLATFALLIALLCTFTYIGWKRYSYLWRPLHPFWGAVFDGHRNTLIVPGDVGFAMQTGLTHGGITLPAYASGAYRSVPNLMKGSIEEIAHRLGRRRYITLGDMQFGQWLIQQPEASHGRSVLSYARDLKQEDFQNSNVILLGSKPVNPWVSLFDGHLDFIIEHDYATGEETVYNHHPRKGEPSRYFFSSVGKLSPLYCSIAFDRGNKDHGTWLIIQGTTMAGNQLCFNLLMNNQLWNSIVGPLKHTDRFEILLRSGGTSIDASQAVILSTHVH